MLEKAITWLYTWLRQHRREAPWYAILAAVVGTVFHVFSSLLGWWGIPIDLLGVTLLMVVGGFVVSAILLEEAAQEWHRNPDVWVNISPGPSAEPLAGATDEHSPDQFLRDGEFIVPPEALGSIYIGPPEPRHAAPEPSSEQRLLDDIFPEVGDHYPVLIAIHEEMLAQVDQWGHQSHPHGTGGSTARMNRTNAKKAVEAAAAAGTLTWVDVLREEFTEAVAETDLVKLDEELTQIAAVCATWKQAIAHEMATAIGMEADPE